MKRKIEEKLKQWQNRTDRKPLILRGARQVGKTYILQKFGEENYANTAYFNFERDRELRLIFENSKDPERIIEQLTLALGETIEPGRTLIIFDEIQECPKALNTVKYFYEMAPEFHLVCAGSLLGVKLANDGFPVGKVEFFDMYPMTFAEFLEADGSPNLVEVMARAAKGDSSLLDAFHEQLLEKLRTFYVVGGMPEAVKVWVEKHNIEKVNYIQSNILISYINDFAKHTSGVEANRISQIWNSIPSQLARENKKFLYQAAKEGARAREYEAALNWLKDANLISKCYLVLKCDFPLKFYEDLSAFKIYLGDVGLLRQLSELSSEIILLGNELFEEYKGALAENYVVNMLIATLGETPHYYSFDRKEIDFVIQVKNQIIPIEVKSGKTTNNNSLTSFNEDNKNKLSVRFSTNKIKQDGKILNLPLYLAEFADQIIEQVLRED